MKLAVFTVDGFPSAFFDPDIHGENIPAEAVEVSDAQWAEFIDNVGHRKWMDGEVVAYDPASEPTITDYENAIQNLVDETAREKQFRDGVTLASYIGSTMPKWAGEAMAFVAWRDNVWRYAYGELAKVQAGQRQQPTVEKFLGEIGPIAWPLS